jgi:DNA (cytosine-5)-methyltransferase 1
VDHAAGRAGEVAVKFASLFTGIGGFDLGLQRAGMECVLQCDNDKSCLKLLSQKWPDVKRIEDVKKIKRIDADLICGGFPCQDVSIAGKRKGLAGERSGLWSEFARVIKKSHPQWVIVENVPGLLSSHGGRDFQTIIESLVECGYGVAWRILDSRYFGVAQRRRRVFIVGSLGSGRSAEVLFESESVSGNIEKGGEEGQDASAYAVRLAQTSSNGWGIREDETGTLDNTGAGAVFAFSAGQGAKAGGIGYGKESPTLKGAGSGTNQVPTILANPLGSHHPRNDLDNETYIARPLRAQAQTNNREDSDTYVCGTLAASGAGVDRPAGQGNELDFCIPVGKPLSSKIQRIDYETETLVTWNWQSGGDVRHDFNDKPMLHSGQTPAVGVRRLTPLECERLQSFPDFWTEGFADSTRYRMLGNAVTVNVIEWIGNRIMEATK